MAIPGRTLNKLDVRGKVRIGERRVSKKGREYPAAVDYFVSDDPDFLRLYPDGKPGVLRVVLAYPTVDEAFSTGLERWLKKKTGSGQVLACYTKDAGDRPVALRLTDFLADADETRGPERGQRTPITCTADACPFFRDKSCKPMGRLVFFLDGDGHGQPLQIDTKSWNSIEQISGALKSAQRLGPLDQPGRVFELSVAFHTKGSDRFPVLAIQEVRPEVVITPDNVNVADALLAARGALERGDEPRVVLAALLDGIRPGWRDDQRYIDRIREVGAEAALQGVFQRFEA